MKRERMLALFSKGRLDGFINFPSHLIQARRQFTSLPEVASFTIVPQRVIGNASAACSKSATGRVVISAIDNILADPKRRFEYISLLTEGMLDTEKRILHEATGTLDEFNSASTPKTTR